MGNLATIKQHYEQLAEDGREARAEVVIAQGDLEAAIKEGRQRDIGRLTEVLRQAEKKARQIGAAEREAKAELMITEGDQTAAERRAQETRAEQQAAKVDEQRGELAAQREEEAAKARRFARENEARRGRVAA